jgi:hypothetical protein
METAEFWSAISKGDVHAQDCNVMPLPHLWYEDQLKYKWQLYASQTQIPSSLVPF